MTPDGYLTIADVMKPASQRPVKLSEAPDLITMNLAHANDKDSKGPTGAEIRGAMTKGEGAIKGISDAYRSVSDGIGNLADGYNWNGTPGSEAMAGLSGEAAAGIETGAAGMGGAIGGFASGGIADHPRFAGPGSHGGRSHLTRGPKAFLRGLVRSPTPGRGDRVRATLRKGSYVVPADVVSGLGQGNTDAGSAVLGQAVGGHGVGDAEEYASGGIAGDEDGVPVLLSGGEYAMTPQEVAAIGGGSHARGADVLDRLVQSVRRSTAATMQQLPGPK